MTLIDLFTLFMELIFAHFVADFGLQSAEMARLKAMKNNESEVKDLPYFMRMGHCMINAAIVYLFTGILWMAIAEIYVHAFIDRLKIKKITNLKQDQILHFISKVFYIIIYVLIAWFL